MWIAKLVDQKQGEARVVDQREVLRCKLEDWLKTRPTVDELAERGVLGRGPRFVVARQVVNNFLRERLHHHEEERSRIPAGDFVYSDRLCALLGGTGPAKQQSASLAEHRLNAIQAERKEAQSKVDEMASTWAQAADNCERSIRTDKLPKLAANANEAVQRLEELHKATGGSLACVFNELESFRRLIAKERCMEDIVAMMEKTEALREAVFAWSSAEALPLASLEEIPAIWAKLPPRSRSVGVRRLRFLLNPIKTSLSHELKDELVATKRWPLESGSQAMTVNAAGKNEKLTSDDDAPPPPSAARVMWLCAELLRAERAEENICQEEGATQSSDREKKDVGASWAGDALAAPLVARFRWFFFRTESDLCRMDKPEWALQFLSKMCSEHCAELDKWQPPANVQAVSKLHPSQATALQASNLRASFAIALAREAREFIRARMPVLVEPGSRALLLQHMSYLVRLHGELVDIAGPSAAAAVFADFDANRPIEVNASSASGASPDVSSTEPSAAAAGPRSWMKGLSQLRKGASGALKTASAAQVEETGAALFDCFEKGLEEFVEDVDEDVNTAKFSTPVATQSATGSSTNGYLDVWASADGELVREWLASVTKNKGSGWKPRRVSAASAAAEEGPEAAEFATLLADRFEKARERAECLASKKARKLYAGRVFESGLRTALSAIRSRWNHMKDPLGDDARETALLVETLEELCRFLDSFVFTEFVVGVVDDANQFRLGTMDKLAEMLADLVRSSIGQLYTEANVLTFVLAEPLKALALRLRPTNFQVVAQKAITSYGELLTNVLMRSSAFANDGQMATFAANCQADLKSVLSQVVSLDKETAAPLQKLWDGCALLALRSSDAADAFAALRQIHRCVSAGDLRKPWPEAAAAASEAATGRAARCFERSLPRCLRLLGLKS